MIQFFLIWVQNQVDAEKIQVSHTAQIRLRSAKSADLNPNETPAGHGCSHRLAATSPGVATIRVKFDQNVQTSGQNCRFKSRGIAARFMQIP